MSQSKDRRGKGDRYILCVAPEGPSRQNVPVPFSALSRRDVLRTASGAAVSLISGYAAMAGESSPPASAARADKAMIAITLDLEMARNFPKWEDTHWDYEKGNLNQAAKDYTLAVARRVKDKGGRVHCFVVGQVFEQENVDWLKELAEQGHFLGNHTYDHVYLLATQPKDIQFRFARAPWLIEGKTPVQVIRENIQLCTAAMKSRLGIAPAGFRTPGGFQDGLTGRSDIQKMLLGLGFDWVSSRYPAHPMPPSGTQPDRKAYDAIVTAQRQAQPFVYPTGLVEVPMSPVSDIVAFRTGRWQLDRFLEAVRAGVEWAIANQAVYDFLAHPSALGVMDPGFRTVDMICELVRKAADRAEIVDLGTIARRVRQQASSGPE
jgi:peptidoglycan/xylan/chitin deacetylase (PgdA/CDA1 family)